MGKVGQEKVQGSGTVRNEIEDELRCGEQVSAAVGGEIETVPYGYLYAKAPAGQPE